MHHVVNKSNRGPARPLLRRPLTRLAVDFAGVDPPEASVTLARRRWQRVQASIAGPFSLDAGLVEGRPRVDNELLHV
jgi:hypothetical protein